MDAHSPAEGVIGVKLALPSTPFCDGFLGSCFSRWSKSRTPPMRDETNNRAP